MSWSDPRRVAALQQIEVLHFRAEEMQMFRG